MVLFRYMHQPPLTRRNHCANCLYILYIKVTAGDHRNTKERRKQTFYHNTAISGKFVTVFCIYSRYITPRLQLVFNHHQQTDKANVSTNTPMGSCCTKQSRNNNVVVPTNNNDNNNVVEGERGGVNTDANLDSHVHEVGQASSSTSSPNQQQQQKHVTSAVEHNTSVAGGNDDSGKLSIPVKEELVGEVCLFSLSLWGHFD